VGLLDEGEKEKPRAVGKSVRRSADKSMLGFVVESTVPLKNGGIRDSGRDLFDLRWPAARG
jgi:hypothetical protein